MEFEWHGHKGIVADNPGPSSAMACSPRIGRSAKGIPFMMKSAFTVKELIREIGIGRTTLYQEIRAGRIVARKRGRSTLILRPDVERYLHSLARL